ncbi:type IV secretion system DNA-binding domain-containing protein [Lacipirellula sp.]|uniref:type IV secretory system conjugative DNA transfer family protein n=1 Tax=Lacipirellula sp. TaxID=2691419 RepID=UPI003D0BFB24
MNNFNCRGNNNLPSEGDRDSRNPIPEQLFNPAIQFELTSTFHQIFSSSTHVSLPSSFNLPYWQRCIAAPAVAAEESKLRVEHEQALRLYADEVAKIEAENRRRTLANRRTERDHANAVAVFRDQYRQYESDLDERRQRELETRECARKQVTTECIQNLERSLDGQRTQMHEALDQVREATDDEKRCNEAIQASWFFIVTGFATLLWWIPISCVCACLSFLAWWANKGEYRAKFAGNLNAYRLLEKPGNDAKKIVFVLRGDGHSKSGEEVVSSPVYLAESVAPGTVESRSSIEAYPLGHYERHAFEQKTSLFDQILWFGLFCCVAMPGIGLIVMLFIVTTPSDDLKEVRRSLDVWEIIAGRKRRLSALLKNDLKKPDVMRALVNAKLNGAHLPKPTMPREPGTPSHERLLPLPSPPVLQVPKKPTAPGWCFDTSECDNFSHILKGACVYSGQHVRTLARFHLFADKVVQPYQMMGSVPIPLVERAPGTLVLGSPGSGKSTFICKFASALLPLTRDQANRIATRKGEFRRFPRSGDEFGRSHTHQAVVYNAKGEYLNHLKAFGFDQDVDLFNFDPADPKCYAWDVAADIDSADSITQFAEQLIPRNTSAKQSDGYEMWLSNARGAVEAVIVSFRNAARAAGKVPNWNLRDLVRAFATKETLKRVLLWHDNPQERVSRYFDLASSQQSSIFVTLWEAIDKFAVIGNRWHDAEQQGRIISLKQWARFGSRTVLLLPNTLLNVQRYAPLNATLLKAITNIVLTHKYSYYFDSEGKQRCYRREFIFDEIGTAGRMHDLERLMSEGRSFGVNVTIGLHQLSQLTETYGENLSETILGLCANRVFLRTDDQRTAKWMSENIGTCVRAYDKKCYTYGIANGKSFTTTEQRSSGTTEGNNRGTVTGITVGATNTVASSINDSTSVNRGHSSTPGQNPTTSQGSADTTGTGSTNSHAQNVSASLSKSEGSNRSSHVNRASSVANGGTSTSSSNESNSTELRGEATIEIHEFMSFPQPAATGLCEVVIHVPTLPPWREQLSHDQMAPLYDWPERLQDWPTSRSPDEDELVSRSVAWSTEDLERLGLDTVPLPDEGSESKDEIRRLQSQSPPDEIEPKLLGGNSESDKEEGEGEDDLPPGDFKW